jgi:serine/threonine protein phosphatase PrpC
VKIEEGDIVILGSDGLFDNLYDDEILEEVQNCIDQQTDAKEDENDTQKLVVHQITPQAISDALAWRAKIVSEDPDNPSSPFQVRAMHEGLYYQVIDKHKIALNS